MRISESISPAKSESTKHDITDITQAAEIECESMLRAESRVNLNMTLLYYSGNILMGLDITHGPSRRADDTRAPEIHPEIDYGADESDGDTGGWNFSQKREIFTHEICMLC